MAGGGYVNLFLDAGAGGARACTTAWPAPAPPPAAGARVIVEHTSINPNKAAHIGHLRNAVLGDTFVRVLRHRGREVGVQNYIDDTGVQVADVVVGFLHLEKQDAGRGRGADRGPRFDYYCWDLYARVGDFYAADPANKKLAGRDPARDRGGRQRDRAAGRASWPRAIVDCHLATMERLGIRYDLLAHESDILRLHFWDRAFELLKETGAIRLETEGKNAGCWVLAMGGGTPTGRGAARRGQDHRPLERHRHLHRQGHRLPALEAGPARPRLPLPAPSHATPTATCCGPRPADAGETGRARASATRASVYNVIDVGQSYPQRVVKAGVAALGHPEAAEGSHHLAYEKVVLSPATARALGYAVSEDDARGEGLRPQGAGGQGRRPHGRAGRPRRGPRSTTRDPERDAAARARPPPPRSPPAPCATSC